MDDRLNQWQKNNETYLAAALAWLRLRLQAMLNQGANPPAAAASVSPAGTLFDWMRPETAAPAEVGLAAEAETELARAARALAEAEAADPPPALVLLAQRFGLSHFEQEVLLLCAAMELDTRLPALCAQAQADSHRPYPTFALALALFDDPVWEVLSPERPLRYWRLIEINQAAAQPLTTSPLRADERLVNYLKGLNYLDDRLGPLMVPLEIEAREPGLPASQQAAVEAIIGHLQQFRSSGPPPTIQLVGPDSLSKQAIAWQTAVHLGLHLYRLPVELLPSQAAELETLARLWERESLLLPVVLYLDAHAVDGSTPSEAGGQAGAPPLSRFLARSNGLFFLATRDVQAGLSQTSLVLDVAKPTPVEQQAAWGTALGVTPAGDGPARLAGQFNLNLTTIQQIVRIAQTKPVSGSQALDERLWQACLVKTRPRLDTLAQRLEAKATWDEIVLPAEQLELLRQIAAQVGQRSRVYDGWGWRDKMNRGLGISALFAGDSGTGKTMAAEVIANDLRLNLYRIDLSAVVSKYIGETEKNLRQLFDAAEDGGAILFFDEADALFGKRSEVKDSHDRYANIEVNYLLQRMEAYRGLAILATNMKSALDPAFMRRLRFIVTFPFPSPADRQRIWQKVFPPQTPLADLAYERLARLNLTGGSIHNIALNAAFLAAQTAEKQVTMPLILRAARTEFRKLERPINEVEFKWE